MIGTKYAYSEQMYGNLFQRKQNIAYTHSGIFHADDVCSTALLEIVFPDIVIKRVSRVPEDAEFAFDIGLGKYDHHQHAAKERSDGAPYAAFGLLWRDIGPTLFNDADIELFDRCFVRPVDKTDCTGEPNPFSSTIKSFNPTWDQLADNPEKGQDDYFREAVEYAKIAILRQFDRIRSTEKAAELVQKCLDDKENYITRHSIMFKSYLPHMREVVKRNVWFTVYPSNRDEGHWNVDTVPIELGKDEYRINFPLNWFHKRPEGCTFLHRSGDMAVFNSLDNARKALEYLESKHPYEPEYPLKGK